MKVQEEWLNNETGKYKCPKCGKEYSKGGICGHYWRNHTENGQKFNPGIGYKNGTRKGWNKGLTKETDERLKKTSNTCKEKFKSGELKIWCEGKKLSKEHKKNISNQMKNFLNENPDKVPYLSNHNSKGESYPEKYFKELFEKENIYLIQYYRIKRYELDFVDPINKIDIEIDGEQHYNDKKIIESDKRRNKYLENLGWKNNKN